LPLDQFKEIRTNYFNFRCPLCSDSQKSKTKKRGYLIPSKDGQGLFFHCFNCSESMSMSYFIKTVSPPLMRDYNKENFRENKKESPPVRKEIVILNDVVKNIQPVTGIPIAEEYLDKRNILPKYWKDIYYTENYKKWIVENYLPEKYQHIERKDERLVFPLYTQQGELIGLQGRSLDPNNEIRYLTVKIKETQYSLCYGLEKIDIRKPIIFTEGIFDSLVLDNAVAMLKSNMDLNFIRERFPSSDIIFVFDNEPRNKQIVKNYDVIAKMEEFGLFIWPKNIKIKDLNDLSTTDATKIDQKVMTDFVIQNTVFGKLKKTLALSRWKIL